LPHEEAGNVGANFKSVGFGNLADCHAGFKQHSLEALNPAAMDFLDGSSAERLAKPILQRTPGNSDECRHLAHLHRPIAVVTDKSRSLHHAAVINGKNVG
jgi:hypothetical protein